MKTTITFRDCEVDLASSATENLTVVELHEMLRQIYEEKHGTSAGDIKIISRRNRHDLEGETREIQRKTEHAIVTLDDPAFDQKNILSCVTHRHQELHGPPVGNVRIDMHAGHHQMFADVLHATVCRCSVTVWLTDANGHHLSDESEDSDRSSSSSSSGDSSRFDDQESKQSETGASGEESEDSCHSLKRCTHCSAVGCHGMRCTSGDCNEDSNSLYLDDF